MIVREMKASDWAAVADIYAQGIESGISTFQQVCPSYEAWDSAHLKQGRLVAEIDGNVVGWVVLAPTSARDCYRGVVEVSVYVHKNYRHRGIAYELMTAIEAQARDMGCWTLFSVVFQVNEASLKLHERCGYRVIGYRERIARDRFGNWQNTVHLEKRL